LSGYRNPEKNKKAVGVENSMHNKGLVIDIRIPHHYTEKNF
jgi:uncharacterized protein YcbK (DUF882 family)